MAEKETPVLETKKLGISFGGLRAVSDFNIQIYPGELVGLIGPNGAGKTSVFNLLTGVYAPSEGTVLLNGIPLNGKKTHQFVQAGIARTFQNIRLFKEMSVLENVKIACTKDLSYGLFAASFRTPKFWHLERRQRIRHLVCWRSAAFPMWRRFPPQASLTGGSASWRLPAPWRLT